jgi:hypothetical protein
LTLKKCQTPTKTSSAITALKPTQEQLQAAINQLKELLKQPANVILLDIGLLDQFIQVARFLITNPFSLSESGRALLGLFVQNLDGTISNLQAAQDKRNQATIQEEEHEQQVSRLQAYQLSLQAKATKLKTIDQKVKFLEVELQSWKLKRSQKCLEFQSVHIEGQGLV